MKQVKASSTMYILLLHKLQPVLSTIVFIFVSNISYLLATKYQLIYQLYYFPDCPAAKSTFLALRTCQGIIRHVYFASA
jgi:hypothetical protein